MSALTLAGYPAKVTQVLTRLQQASLIDDETLELIAAAAGLDPTVRSHPWKLLGFLIAYQAMSAKSVPIRDALRMAVARGLPIDLNWSPERWKSEHQRLSRASTLDRLATENVVYDLSRFSVHLPEKFPGYLIKTSRRLGMEGLRQQHCVASYHKRILSGLTAIAAVFVDHARWTVELLPVDDEDRKILIGQIKTRHNRAAGPDVRNRVHAILGVTLPKSKALYDDDPAENLYQENLRRVLSTLRRLNVESVTVNFDGSGDSGSIEYVGFTPKIDSSTKVGILSQTREFDSSSRHWLTQTKHRRVEISEAIEEITYDYLGSTGVDWYNGDGGFGELIIDVAAGSVSLEVNSRFTESVMEVDTTIDIETGLEID